MTDRPIADAGDPAVAPEPGYYPDPSIPGFVRYWGGSAWVPGTSRLAPVEGEVLEPPRFATRRPAPGGLAAGGRVVPPPVVGPGRAGDTGPVYLDQTTGGASFVLGPGAGEPVEAAVEVAGGPVFREVGAAAVGAASLGAASVGAGVDGSGWQADPRAQHGLLETGGAPRWVSWGVLSGASEEGEGRAEEAHAPVAVEVAAGVAPVAAPAVAVVVREPAGLPAVVGEAPVEVPVVVPVVAPGEVSGEAPVEVPVVVPVPAPVVRRAPKEAAAPARRPAARRRPAAAVPAGLGRRLAARVVDTLVMLAVAAAAGVPLGRSVSDHLQEKFDQAKMASVLTHRQVQVWLVDGVVLGKIGVLIGILLFVGLLYEVLPTARTGQTFGKRLARVRVVDAAASGGRSRLGFGRSLLRWVVRQLGLLLLLGLVWPLFDRPARRGWQDRAARTRVVRA
ncbi:RDD family protein [Kitasatospora sp. NPDC101183]|uniref:RDD family protein n=1 Tax=Kitasatospora sp. NPDC101183 TaxID=3364100 RepID=UPI00381610E5